MGINVLFCGLIRNPEMLLRSVRELAMLRRRGLVDRMAFSTWKGQIDSCCDLRRSLADGEVEFVESDEPQYQGTSVFHQMKALELGLDHLDGCGLVLKTRADVYVRPEFLERLAADSHYLEPDRGSDLAVFERKIWVPWFEITKPFYMGDECFFGLASDLRKLINYDVSYDVKYDMDAGRGHIRRFIHPFLPHFPILADYLSFGAKTGHNTAERFAILRRNMETQVFWDCLATYYLIVKKCFRIESDYTPNQIIFRKWSQPRVTVDPDKFDENFSVEKSWNGARGQIYAYNERWLDNVLNRRIASGALAPKLYEALSRCEMKHPSLKMGNALSPDSTPTNGLSATSMEEANVRPKWEANIVCETTFWDRWLASKGRAYGDDFRVRTDPESLLQEHLARHLDKSLSVNRILDVGAGPLTIVNKKCPGTTLEIHAVDALGDIYDQLLRKHRITPVIRTEKLDAEALSRKYPENTFDIVYSRNAIDHAYAPLQAIREMVKVTKPGGYVILQVGVEEGTRTQWRGLHSWNFSLADHTLLLRGQDSREFDVCDLLKDAAQVVDATIEANMIRIVFRKIPCAVRTGHDNHTQSGRLDLCRFLQGMEDYVVLKLSEDFPGYRDHSDIDILCGDCNRVRDHILEVGSIYEQQGFRIDVTNTMRHQHMDFFAPGAKRLSFRFDLVDTLTYEAFQVSPQFGAVVLRNARKIDRGGASVCVPAPSHDLAIRFFEWIEHREKRPDKIKHLNYIKAHYHPDFVKVVNEYTSLKLTVGTNQDGLDLNVSLRETLPEPPAASAPPRRVEAIACTPQPRQSRIDYFMIWGHGLPYADQIIDILRNTKDLRILIVVKKNVGDITRFVQDVYACDTACREHLEKKTRYLLRTDPEIIFILVENRNPQEMLVGEGVFRHLQCMFIKGIKEEIRNRFNPRKPDGKRSEHHVIHASDYESQVHHLLKILGLRSMEYYTRRPNADLDAPFHVEPFERYTVRTVPIDSLRANILDMGLVPIDETPHYKYLTGDKRAYEQYHRKHGGTLLIEDHFPAAYDHLIANLKDDYRTADGRRSLILVQSRKDGTHRILDGVHRAAILKHRGVGMVTVAEPLRPEESSASTPSPSPSSEKGRPANDTLKHGPALDRVIRAGGSHTVGLIFSKDRAMQLRAALESLHLHCADIQQMDMVVLYVVSDVRHREQYQALARIFPGVRFLEQTDFRGQTLSIVEGHRYVLFLVDDNIFVRSFRLGDMIETLDGETDAIGFSLRLGTNTCHCYTLDTPQKLPSFQEVRPGILKYAWTEAQHDFGYPLEVSSSLFRAADVLRWLHDIPFGTPNELEARLDRNKRRYDVMPALLTYQTSVTFCNPVNVVQNKYANRHGVEHGYTSDELACRFARGQAIDVEAYKGLTPHAAHQEVALHFKQVDGSSPRVSSVGAPDFTVVMANYNNGPYIAKAIESVLCQTFPNWELIIVDDGSTDQSLQVIQRYLHDPRIRLIRHERNAGYVSALKTGISHVRATVFGILDSDDALVERAIDTMWRQHVEHTDCGLIYSQYVVCSQDLQPQRPGHCKPVRPGQTNLDVHAVSHFKTFKLADYHKTSGYDETMLYAEDKDIIYKMEEITHLKFVEECLYLYRELPNSAGHDPVKAAIGRQSMERAMAAAYRRRSPAPHSSAVLTTRNHPGLQKDRSEGLARQAQPPQPHGLRSGEGAPANPKKSEHEACPKRAHLDMAERRQSLAPCTNPLDEIAIKHGTDKSSAGHDYMASYYRYFAPWRERSIKILEIGINQGYSLRTWHEFFPNAEIFAIDINPACRALEGGRVHVFIGDQEDVTFLRSVAAAAGGSFDVVIDDGGHFVKQQITSFNTLLPHVVPGGIYVIEDLHTSYWPSFGGGPNKPDTAVEFLKGLVDVVNRHGRKGNGSSPAAWLQADRAEPESPAKEIESIEFCRSMCFVVKKGSGSSAPRVRPDAAAQTSVPAPQPGLSVILTTYNRPELLLKVLEGFARQTAPRESFEVVVVDDGSTPPVQPIVESFADRVQVCYLYQENSGLAAARNAGIRAARGEVILFSDDDDVPAPELVAEHGRSHRENPDERVVVLGHLDWHPDLRVTSLMYYVTHVGGEYFGFDKLQDGHFYPQWKWWGGLVSAKRSLLESVKGPFDRRLRFGYEDTELVCRLQDKQIRVLYNAKARSWILRPVDFQDFCRRCVRQGRALQRVAALHPEILVPRYKLQHAAAEYHERFAASLEKWTDTVEKLEALQKTEIGAQSGAEAQRLRTLYGYYGQCFRGYLLQGYVEECQAIERGTRTMADDVNASVIVPSAAAKRPDASEEPTTPAAAVRSSASNRPLNITFVNTNTPGFDVGSSNVRIYHLLKTLVAAGHHIDHLYHYEYPDDARYIAAFAGAIRFIRTGNTVDSFRDYLRSQGVTTPDCVWITNLWTVPYGQYVLALTRWLKQHLPQTKIILDTMDFHHKKFVRQFALSKDPQDKAKADAFLKLERELYPLADVVVVVTDVERQDLLRHVKADLNVAIIPNIHRVLTETPPLAHRKHLCYLGSFRIKHNLDAVRWFQDRVLPLILKEAPDCELHIMGYANQEHADKLKPHPQVRMIGYVEDAEAAVSQYRLFVCPMVYGSGMKGKMGTAAGAGTPIVTTTIGAEGFGLTDGRDCFIADDPQTFADRCLRLLRDDALWREISDAARRLITEKFGVEAVGRQVGAFLKEIVPALQPDDQDDEHATWEPMAHVLADLETRYRSMPQQSPVKLTTARRLGEIARRIGSAEKRQAFACEAERMQDHLEAAGLLHRRAADPQQPIASAANAFCTNAPQCPKVTVIMSCHNAEKFLREALDSVQGQTLRDWELFLVDDASQDGTRPIIEEYARQDARIRPYYFDTNDGPYVRRNFAIQQARSEFVVIHDADDIMLPTKLEVLYGAISRDERLVMVGSLYRTFMDRFTGLEYTECSILPLEHDEIIEKFQGWQHGMSHGSAIIRRAMFDRIGLYDANPFASDSFWSAKLGTYAALAGAGVLVKNVPESLTLIRMHAANQTRLLSIFDPRNRRIRFRQYCELKLQHIRKKMASLPGVDLALELRKCKCDDFLTRFKAEIPKWESQPPNPRLIEKLLESAVMLFNGRFYISCINILNGVEGMDAQIRGRVVGFELLRGMAFYALGMKEHSQTCLEHEIRTHGNPGAQQFLTDILADASHFDVQDWCDRHASRFHLGLTTSRKGGPEAAGKLWSGLQDTRIQAITPERSARDGTTQILTQK